MRGLAPAAGTEAAPDRAGPHPRATEGLLLAVVACAILVGHLSLAATRAGGFSLGDPLPVLVYLAGLGGVHLAFVLTRRDFDPYLLPIAGLLGGISLLLMERLAGAEGTLAALQLQWLLLGLAALALTAVVVRGVRIFRDYRYTWAAAGIGLLLLVFLLGEEVNGARLSLRIGPLSGQPSELLKVILVIFLAGYLAERRTILARDLRLGPIPLPPLPWLLPLLGMLGLAIAVVVVQRDLGAALLFYGVFLGLLWVATRRASWILAGVLLAAGASVILYGAFSHVRVRVDAWADPWADPLGAGYQALRALFAFARGGIAGTGLGAGLPEVAGAPAIPAITTDLAFAALGEELGLIGILALCGCYLVIGGRGLAIALRAGDELRTLLAVGLTLVVVLQAALIMAGNLKLVPLTGITLPFISYGGSSLLVNAIVIGLLLALDAQGRVRR